MSYFNYNGYKVHYSTNGKGQPMLLLHGNTMSSRMFSGIVHKYSKHFKIILIDKIKSEIRI